MYCKHGIIRLLGFSAVIVWSLTIGGCVDGDKSTQKAAGADGVQKPAGAHEHGAYPEEAGPLAEQLQEYMTISDERTDTSGNFLDHWGSRYVYTMPGEHLPEMFDLRGPGKNRRAGDRDDIKNWQ